MAELDPLGGTGEHDSVLADDAAAAQGGETDRTGGARTGVTVTGADGGGAKLYGAAGRGGTAEKERGAARGIDLVAMMHFQDFDVELLAEGGGDTADEGREKVDPEAHIARADNAGVAGGRCGGRVVLGPQAGSAERQTDHGRGG